MTNRASPKPTNSAPRKGRYSDAVIIAGLQKAQGLITVAARLIGCNPSTIRDRIAQKPQIAQIVDDARESLLDTAELSLQKAIQNGEAWAVCFALKTIGKNRGYVERIESTGKDGDALIVRVIRDGENA